MRRPWLGVLLGLTLLASAATWWHERRGLDAAVVQPVQKQALATNQNAVTTITTPPPSTNMNAPDTLSFSPNNAQQPSLMPVIAAAESDPFYSAAALAAPAMPVVPPMPPMPVAPVVAIVPPKPMPPPKSIEAPTFAVQAPQFPYKVFGRMLGPEGKNTLYLALEERLIPVQTGTELEGGFVVERLEGEEVYIRHHATKQEIRITLPKQT